MTWTYDPTDLSTDLAQVRLLIGDTDTNDQLLSDEEINYFLSVTTTVTGAAILAAQAIQANFSRLADTTVETVNVRYSQKADGYAKLVDDLKRQENATSFATPSVMGVSIDAMNVVRADADIVPKEFEMGQFDNPQGPSRKIDGQDV